jgi:hypothetical protein
MLALDLPFDQVIFLASAACGSKFARSDRVEMVRLLIADTTAQNVPPDPDSQREFAELKRLLAAGGFVGANYIRAVELVASLWTRMGRPGLVE